MTNLEIYRILNLADTFKSLRIYKDTPDGFREFGFGDVYKLSNYFSLEPAQSVNYKAVIYDGRHHRSGMLTIKRNGDFTFIPA